MARVNVYLPDELADDVRRADLNVSAIAQEALRERLAALSTGDWLATLAELDPVEVNHDVVRQALEDARHDFGA